MTTLKKLTEKEYNLITTLKNAIYDISREGGIGSNIDVFFENKDVTESDFDGVLYDIKNDELFEAIGRFETGRTEAAAMDSDGVGFVVVEILHGFYDNVFGYTESNGEKTFYLCESKDNYNEELERDETHFFVDDEPVILNDCIRTNIGGGF